MEILTVCFVRNYINSTCYFLANALKIVTWLRTFIGGTREYLVRLTKYKRSKEFNLPQIFIPHMQLWIELARNESKLWNLPTLVIKFRESTFDEVEHVIIITFYLFSVA